MENNNTNVISTGTIKKRLNNGDVELVNFNLIWLDESYKNELYLLQHDNLLIVDDPNMIEPVDMAFIDKYMVKNGKTVGVVAEGKLIAYNMIIFPKDDSENLGYDLNIPKDELDKVVHFDNTFVSKQYRGNKLIVAMQDVLLDYIKKEPFLHLCITIAPNNYPSLKSVLNQRLGFIKGIKYKYNNKLRYVIYNNLRDEIILNNSTTLKIMNTDIDKQKELLDNGYYGYQVEKIANDNIEEFLVLFAKTSD